jgi:DNA-binding GntR family transcriptional regulator
MLKLLRNDLYESIKWDIISGVYAPGDRLVEAQLAERFQTSKTPVREALARLVQEDHLEVFPRIGYLVTECTVELGQAVFQFRTILECTSARLAAQSITPDELRQLEALHQLDVRSNDPSSYHQFFEQNRRFHLVVAGAARNSLLYDAIERVFDKVDRLTHYRLDAGATADRMMDEHRILIDALHRHDPDEAERAMLFGLDRTRDEVLAVLTRQEATRAPRASRAAQRG